MTDDRATDLPPPTLPAPVRWTVGSLEVVPLYDGTLLTPPELIYSLACAHLPAVPGSLGLDADDWLAHPTALTGGHLELTFGGYLVRGADERVVLVDAGQGPTHWAPAPEIRPQVVGRLLESLAAVGVAPEDVTDVLITHLHADHVGWVSPSGAATFPNATYRCHRADLEAFLPRDPVATRAMTPVLDRLVAFNGDVSVAGPVGVRPTPGHTPGTTVVTLESEGQRLWLLGDVYHSVPELVDATRWAGMADADAPRALQARIDLALLLEAEEIPFAAAHFAGMPLQRLVRADGRLALVDADDRVRERPA